MWRAWGITLLFLSRQDLGPRVNSPDHEFALRPPAGWILHRGAGPTLAKFTEAGDLKTPAEMLITHLYSSNPTPLESFKKQAKENIAEKYPGSKILEEKDVTIGGKAGFRVVFTHNEGILFKTVVHRTNLEYYLLDAAYPPEEAGRIRPLIEASLNTFEIVPLPMSSEDRAIDARTLAALADTKIDPALLGERWYTIHLSNRKVGHMRFKMADAGGLYSFETRVQNDYGEGNTDSIEVHGSFSSDGRTQKLDTEEVKVNPKQRWVVRATAAVASGRAKISRDINGIKEERSIPLEDGVFLSDVAECVRSLLVGAGKGTYLLKSLSPYSDEWNSETIEVGGLESLEVDGQTRECMLVLAYVGRRKNMMYYYGPDRWVFRVGGPREPFAIRASTKEAAEK
jgi:hypothetical protein